jgi:predicted MFS family arabinose efflux permease
MPIELESVSEETAAAPASAVPPPRLWSMATVMATGVFATTFVQLQSLGNLPFYSLLMNRMGLDSAQAAAFINVATLPWSFKAIAGLMVDGFPLFGSRRRGYLLMSAGAAAVMWVLMGFASHNANWLLVLAVAMNIATVFGSTTSGGLLVEAGQRFGVSGRLSSLRVLAQNLGAGIGVPLGGLLARRALGFTSAVAIAPLLCMFFATWFLLREPAALPRAAAFWGPLWAQIKNVLTPRMAWAAALVFFIQAVPTFRSTSFYDYQTKTLHFSDQLIGLIGFAGYGAALLSSGVYAWACRKLTLRRSLYGTFILTAVSALPYLAYSADPIRATVIEAVGQFLLYLAYLPLFDLAVRSTPKGSEALGYSLLISVWNIGMLVGLQAGPMLYEHVFGKNMTSLLWLNAVVTLGGVFLVIFLPSKMADQREGG